jgi:hypothetical protein
MNMIISITLTLPRTMKGMIWMSFISFLSIFTADMITMITMSIESESHADLIIQATVETNLYTGFQVVSNIVFAYCAHVSFIGLIAEMKSPKDFKESLFMLQGFEICLHITIVIIAYFYVGPEVNSSASSSTGSLMSKIAFGSAISTIIGAGVMNGHIDLIYIFYWLHLNYAQ